MKKRCCVQQGMPAIPALGRLRQEYGKFETNLGYIVRSCLKKLNIHVTEILEGKEKEEKVLNVIMTENIPNGKTHTQTGLRS
jgi:hypothetical protein